MRYRATVAEALSSAVEREPSLDTVGLALAMDGEGEILRYPASLNDPYIYCSAGPDPVLAAPENPATLRWRMPVTPADTRFNVPYDPGKLKAKPSPETDEDLINFGLDLVVLALGVGVVVATGGVGAIGLWGGLQLATGGLLAVNDAARTVSDVGWQGRLGKYEDNSDSYKSGMDAALFVQILDGPGIADAFRLTQAAKPAAETWEFFYGLFSASKDAVGIKKVLSETQVGIRDAASGNFDLIQQFRLGHALNIDAFMATANQIRAVLALRVANDFGGTLITLGQAMHDGPLGGAYQQFSANIPAFHFSLLFPNSDGVCRVCSIDTYSIDAKQNRRFFR